MNAIPLDNGTGWLCPFHSPSFVMPLLRHFLPGARPWFCPRMVNQNSFLRQFFRWVLVIGFLAVGWYAREAISRKEIRLENRLNGGSKKKSQVTRAVDREFRAP